jgi:hypothetical protein
LTACHALCRAIGVEPLPKTCEQCEVGELATKFGRFMLKRIIGCTNDTGQYRDLIEWGRSDSEEKVQTNLNVQSCEPIPRRQARYFATRSSKRAAKLS